MVAKQQPISGPARGDGLTHPLWKFWGRRRYLLALLSFFGFFNVFTMRVNMSVAITAMTTRHEKILENGTTVVEQEFAWDSQMQGLVLGSYFYGYVATQVIGGVLAARFGGNHLFGLGNAVTAVLSLLTPTLATTSVYGLLAVRVTEGLVTGVAFPCMHEVWSHWAPPSERSRLTTFANSGSYFGTVFAMMASGALCAHVGWPWVFYVFGIIGLVWYVLWVIIVKRTPEDDPSMDPGELKYIQDSLGTFSRNGKERYEPWGKILVSMPTWALIVANFCENWGFITLLTQLPTFMKETLGVDLRNAGVLSALPYFVLGFSIQIAGQIADRLLANKYFSVTQVRKAFCCGAMVLQSLFIILTVLVLTPTGASTFLTLAIGVGGFAGASILVNQIEISPPHASILMGMGNTAASLPGMISPTVTGFLVRTQAVEEWREVFYIASGIYLFGAIFYGLFGSGDQQPWSVEESKKPQETNVLEC